MKKKLTAIILFFSIVASLLAISAISGSAAKLQAPTVSTSLASNGIGVKWNKVSGAKGYCLYMGYDNKWIGWKYISPSEYDKYFRKYGHYPVYKGTLSSLWYAPHTNKEKFISHELIPTKQYIFQVNTCNENGGNIGKWSNVATSKHYLPAVSKFEATDSKINSGSANMGWTIVSNFTESMYYIPLQTLKTDKKYKDFVEVFTYQLVRCDNTNRTWKTVFEGSVGGHPMSLSGNKWFVYHSDTVSKNGRKVFYYQIRPYYITPTKQKVYGVWSKVLEIKA